MKELKKHGYLWPLGAVVAALLVIAGLRVDTDVFVFIIGVGCGWLSGVPSAVLVTILVMQQRNGRTRRERRRQEQPPVVVVTGGAQAPQLGYPSHRTEHDADLAPLPARREFSIIGDETE